MDKRRGVTRLGKVAALTGIAVIVTATAVTAHTEQLDDGGIDNAKSTHSHDLQHGDDTGHLPPTDDPRDGLDLVSSLTLKNAEPGKIADVGVLENHAYLAAWGGQTCKYNGVHVVDISDVAAPKEVAFIHSKEGSYPGEGVQALSISTAAFDGDILVTNNETCNNTAGFGGMNIYDVTDPAHPTPLTVGYGDDATSSGAERINAHEIHSVFAWDAGDRAYAVLVDNEEAADVDIVDITDPRAPVFVQEYNLAERFPQITQEGLDEVFLHDMVVKQIDGRFIMLASYWDAGYVRLDVTDPAKATYVADSDFPDPDTEGLESRLKTPERDPVPPEGNAHQAEFTADDVFVLGADEDFAPYALTAKNETDGTDIDASQGSDTKKLEPGTLLAGQSRFVGRACDGDTTVPTGDGTQIAVVERGVCTFTEKVGNVEAAGGYTAILIFNRTGSDACNGTLGMSVRGGIPTFGVAPREQGFAIFGHAYDDAACLAGDGSQLSGITVGTTGDELAFSSYFDGWGYVRLLDATSMQQLDTYAIPEAHDAAFADGFGDLSVHEVATSPARRDVAYLSYYAGGLRVVDVDVDRKGAASVKEVAAFIDEGGNNFWGVEVFTSGGKEYVAASDRDRGLYIFEYAPVNNP